MVMTDKEKQLGFILSQIADELNITPTMLEKADKSYTSVGTWLSDGIPYDVKINENAARTLEYAYDDWCIYRLAKELKRPQEEIDLFAKRALNYRNLFDPSTKLMRGKNKDGKFMEPFSALKWGDAFTEGNSWHYTWSVFHDPQGLIDLMGGDKEFTRMLDSVFIVPPVYDESYYGFVIPSILATGRGYMHIRQELSNMAGCVILKCQHIYEPNHTGFSFIDNKFSQGIIEAVIVFKIT